MTLGAGFVIFDRRASALGQVLSGVIGLPTNLARPAGLGTAGDERSESPRFPEDCRGAANARSARWRARQDSNLRPPA